MFLYYILMKKEKVLITSNFIWVSFKQPYYYYLLTLDIKYNKKQQQLQSSVSLIQYYLLYKTQSHPSNSHTIKIHAECSSVSMICHSTFILQ